MYRRLPQNILFHRFWGVRYPFPNSIDYLPDVAKITDIQCGKRLFCINDKDYPFYVKFKYHDSIFSFMCYKTLGVRCADLHHCKKEIREILKKQELLEQYRTRVQFDIYQKNKK